MNFNEMGRYASLIQLGATLSVGSPALTAIPTCTREAGELLGALGDSVNHLKGRIETARELYGVSWHPELRRFENESYFISPLYNLGREVKWLRGRFASRRSDEILKEKVPAMHHAVARQVFAFEAWMGERVESRLLTVYPAVALILREVDPSLRLRWGAWTAKFSVTPAERLSVELEAEFDRIVADVLYASAKLLMTPDASSRGKSLGLAFEFLAKSLQVEMERPLSPRVLQGLVGEMAAFQNAFPWEYLFPVSLPWRKHDLIGSRPNMDGYLQGIADNLRGWRTVLPAVVEPLFHCRHLLAGRLKDSGGSETDFHVLLQRGEYETQNGLCLRMIEEFRQGTPDDYIGQVGIHFGPGGILRIVNIQGANIGRKRNLLESERGFRDRFEASSPLDLLLASVIFLARRWGLSRVEGVRDGAQLARLDAVLSGRAKGGFYDLFFKRFGFGKPGEGGDFWSLDLTTLGDPEDYFALVLARPSRARPRVWERLPPNPDAPAARVFRNSLVPALSRMSWRKRRRGDWSEDGSPLPEGTVDLAGNLRSIS